ncbi:hypothetical protein CDAR_600481 [Caerostris darwini]|uniref:Cytochrome P450 n=1 Tax=Caerostris darwini TaxID=1538125 RepID=A0AAV4TW97_9ARAC|nr:hypothetical protein CDAR_600481 [Caerostris darwini]
MVHSSLTNKSHRHPLQQANEFSGTLLDRVALEREEGFFANPPTLLAYPFGTPFALFEGLIMLSFKPITRLVSRGHFIFKLPRSQSQLKGPTVRAFAPRLW